jgi:hypothetical protein
MAPFYDNLLRNNSREPRRKRVQMVHMDTNAYATLLIECVAYADFVRSTEELLEEGMSFARPGGCWQHIQRGVLGVDVCKPRSDGANGPDLSGSETTL